VVDKREAHDLQWGEVASYAATRAEQYCREQAQSRVRQEMFARYGVKFNEQAIRELFSRP